MSNSQYPAASYPQVCNASDVATTIIQDAYDVIATDQLVTSSTGQEVLDFNLPYGSANRGFVQNEYLILANSSKYRVRTVWDGWDQGSQVPITSVHCEALWYSDLGEADPRVFVATNASIAMFYTLVGTGWVIGTVDPTVGSIQVLDFTNPLAILRMLPDAFGGELVFDSINKVVHLVAHRGSTAPVALFAKGKNLAGNSRSVDTTNLITRLYPVGGTTVDPVTGNQLTTNIRTVNGGVDYLENYDFYDTAGLAHKIRTAVATADSITDPFTLLAWAASQLAILSQPAYTYNVQQTNTGSGDAAPVLGDTVRVHDSSLNLDVLARVETRTINLTQPQKTVYTVGTAAYNLSNLNIQVLDPVTVDSTTAIPAAPVSAAISTQHATALSGESMMQVLMSWAQVTQNTDGTPADIQFYRIQWHAAAAAHQPLQVSGLDTSALLGIVQPGITVGGRIAAVNYAGNQSAWTTVGDQTVTSTATVPLAPSTPVLDTTSAPGVIIVQWDGKNNAGGAMAANFLRTEVHVSTTSGFTPSAATRVDSLFGPGQTAIGSVVYGTTYYVKLITLNTDLVNGPASAQASAVVRQIVDTDIITDAVNARILGDNAVAQANIQDLAVGTAEMIDLAVVNAKIGNLAVNDIKVNDIAVGKVTAGILVATYVQLLGKLTTVAGGVNSGARVEFDGAGIRAYNSSNVQMINIDASTGNIVATGTLQSGISGPRVVISASALSDQVQLLSGDIAETTIGRLQVGILNSGTARLPFSVLASPALSSLTPATLLLTGQSISAASPPGATLTANTVAIVGPAAAPVVNVTIGAPGGSNLLTVNGGISASGNIAAPTATISASTVTASFIQATSSMSTVGLGVTGAFIATGGASITNGPSLSGGGSWSGGPTITSASLNGGPSLSGGGSWSGTPSFSGGMTVTGSGNTITVNSPPPSTLAVNARFGSGALQLTTSTRRNKKFIKPLKPAEYRKVLKLVSVEYRSKCKVDDQTLVMHGFTAEQVHETGLTAQVVYEEDGTTPFSVTYERVIVPTLAVVQDHDIELISQNARLIGHDDEIAALKTEVKALRELVEAK